MIIIVKGRVQNIDDRMIYISKQKTIFKVNEKEFFDFCSKLKKVGIKKFEIELD